MVKRSKFEDGKALSGWAYVVLGLFSLATLAVGIPQLFAADFMVQGMARLGYGQAFTQVLGLLWVLAAVGVWFAKYRLWAAVGSLIIIAGAIGTHMAVGDGLVYAIIPQLVLTIGVLFVGKFFKRMSA